MHKSVREEINFRYFVLYGKFEKHTKLYCKVSLKNTRSQEKTLVELRIILPLVNSFGM